MRLQDLFLICILFSPNAAFAKCFDFNHNITHGLRTLDSLAAITQKHSSLIIEDSGTGPDGAVWAAVKGNVNRSLQDLFEDLTTHWATRAARSSTMRITELKNPHFKLYQKVHFSLTPFPLIHIEWTEDWAFSWLNGTRARSEKAFIFYEKTEGTSHIQHLCGNFELIKRSGTKTEVFIYEEVQATQRNQKDTLNGIRTTLKKLRWIQSEHPRKAQ